MSQRRLRLSHRHGADHDALILEIPHDRVEAITLFPEDGILRDEQFSKQELRGVRRAPAVLVERAADAKSRRSLLDQKHRQGLATAAASPVFAATQ